MRVDRLAQLSVDEPAVSVESTMDLSYRELPDAAARLLRLLGLAPATDLPPAAVAAMAGESGPEVACLIAALVSAHLGGGTAVTPRGPA